MVRQRSSSPQGPIKKESPALGKQESSLNKRPPPATPAADCDNLVIAALIEECEEYVRTEEFTKDLSSEILKLFMTERAQHDQYSEKIDPLYGTQTSVWESMNQNIIDEDSIARESYYDNDKHEESPDSIDR